MSHFGVLFVFCLGALYVLPSYGMPSWILALLTFVAFVLEIACVNQFNTTKERVERLEKEMRERREDDFSNDFDTQKDDFSEEDGQ